MAVNIMALLLSKIQGGAGIMAAAARLSTEEYRVGDYTRGVPYCWVADPIRRIAWEYHQNLRVRLLSAVDARQGSRLRSCTPH
jgi:hypothetical protein